MARLIYSTIASADGYVEDADGGIAWGRPMTNCSASSPGIRLDLELLDTRSFAGGAVYLSYRPKPA
jgi:hypothetical protein